MCELSELSELSVLLLRFRRVEVCALSALCAKSPPFELEGMGRRLLWSDEWWSPPRGRAGVRSFVVPSCQRPVHRKRTPGRTPAHHAIHLLTLWTPRWAKKHRPESVVFVLLI